MSIRPPKDILDADKAGTNPDEDTETAPDEDLVTLKPGDFLTHDQILKILHGERDGKHVSIVKFRFDEEKSPDSSGEPAKQDTPPPAKAVQDDRIDRDEPAPESEGSTITVPVDPAISEPPPSFMVRDTNRPPQDKDLRSLAEYHARTRKP